MRWSLTRHAGATTVDDGMPNGARRRVVVVNDDQAILDLYRDMLEELDYEPVTMVTYAIETERIRAAAPDAVILDLEVGPEASYGVDMARQLREDSRLAAIPIVVCTANADALDGERRAMQAIGVPILLKPFSADQIEAALQARPQPFT
jgi:CheY-like chemotaxis protein